jgi:hypothetical protein
MRERLQGGRFRWLNEQMYSQPGEQSYKIMQVTSDHRINLLHEWRLIPRNVSSGVVR